jgi:dipeptidyl-peptidase-3
MPFNHFEEQFADIRILRFQVPNFNSMPLKRKKLLYYLSEASLAGRDILFDQHFRYNLVIRMALERIVQHQRSLGDTSDAFHQLEIYLKRVWFSNGIHHHYSTQKLKPGFSANDFIRWAKACNWDDCFHIELQTKAIEAICNIIFSDERYQRRVSQEAGEDLLTTSCNNFYQGVTQREAEDFYQKLKAEAGSCPPSFGLNSRLVSTGDGLHEEVYQSGGLYSPAIDEIIFWLKKAITVAENTQQETIINTLIRFYETGNLTIFDDYNIQWLQEHRAEVDFINGFIEVYGDPLGLKASWEALVNVTDEEETAKAAVISQNANWFEAHSPVDSAYKKESVQGVTMRVIHAVTLGGDCYPASPLGINLPNADWIREIHGSKSVSLSNIAEAHLQASLTSGVIEEFAASTQEIDLHKTYGAVADHLHTHLHECVGHGSGKMMPGVSTDQLKSYGSVIEETRADLFGLYFMMDNKMLELNLIPSMDAAIAHYNAYLRNGLIVQLTRIAPEQNLEQAHMRNRQLISKWVLEKGKTDKVAEMISRNGKSYVIINNYKALRELFGQLLKEVQRIKSEGDYMAAKELVETYGVVVDRDLHHQVLERYKKLNQAPFTGFLNPVLSPIKDDKGQITDVTIGYHESFSQQMMRYSSDYGFLVREALNAFEKEIKNSLF